MSTLLPPVEADRYVRLPELKTLTGLKATSHVYKLMARGEFPSAIKIGGRAVAWRLSDIRVYLDSRPRAEHTGASYSRQYAPSREKD